jgi:hypothetical protein
MSRCLVVLLTGVSTLLAQRVPTVINSGPPRVPTVVSPGPAMQPPANGVRFGNILFPGGIGPQQHTFPGRLGATVRGYPPYTGVGPGFGHGSHFPQRNRTVVVPYAVPMYYGDPYGGYGGYPQESPNITVVVPQQPAPSVIINHNYTPETAKPVLRDYSSGEVPETSGLRVYEGPKKQPETSNPAQAVDPDKPTIYLIALKDSTIRQAIGYWVEDGALHYVTPQSTITKIELENVDKELSQRLNTERGLELDLNATRVRRR